MNLATKAKNERALAARALRESRAANPASQSLSITPRPVLAAAPEGIDAVVDRIMAGEKTYDLIEAARMTGQKYHVLHRNLKGKLGWLQATDGGGIRITESLLREYIRQMVARGVRSIDVA